MKLTVYLGLILLIMLVVFQNIGGRYGSYALLSLGWLLICITPIAVNIYQKKQFTQIHLVYLIFLFFVILIQPVFDLHPVYILALSLLIIVPYTIFDLTRKDEFSTTPKLKLSNEVKGTCRKLVAADKLDKCFEILLAEVKDVEGQNTILAIQQRWSQNKEEEISGTSTQEWSKIQNLRIGKHLLHLLS